MSESKSSSKLTKYTHLYLYPLLLTISTIIFSITLIQVAKEYRNKNICVRNASKQLNKQLPVQIDNLNELTKKELSMMLAYQLCTHRSFNK